MKPEFDSINLSMPSCDISFEELDGKWRVIADFRKFKNAQAVFNAVLAFAKKLEGKQ